MKTCNNCFWVEQCPNSGRRCEGYYPVEGWENLVTREYYQILAERDKAYKELVQEQQDLSTEE